MGYEIISGQGAVSYSFKDRLASALDVGAAVLAVKQVFATMQGEGSRAGTPCVFIRLVGCNLWAGTATSRSSGAGVCAAWCDTDFVNGSQLEPLEIIDRVAALMSNWPAPAVVISGGEPGLQLRRGPGQALIAGLLDHRIHVAVETNGTVKADAFAHVNHITVSPKLLRGDKSDPLGHILVRHGADLKVVWPQWPHALLTEMGGWAFSHYFLQPLDTGEGPAAGAGQALQAAQRLGWKVSLQTHKFVGID